MAVKIGSLIIQLAVEHGLLQEGLTKAQREVKKTTREIEQVGRGLVDFGQKMAAAVTLPVAAIAKSAVDGFVAQQKAMADVSAALASMGNASGKTAAELAKTADQLEMRSLFDAEVILKQVTAQLLTFGAISGQVFDRAQQAALDMAERLGAEPQAAAIMLGKALQAPAKGLTALGKTGAITQDWIAANKARIQGMLEEGRIAEAQGLILSAVEQQVRGAAQAAADATPWRAAQVAIGQAMDAIGEAVLPIVKAVADGVTAMANEFNKLTPEMKQTIITVAGVAAAAGPLLIVMGSLIQSTAGITAAFVTMGPAASATILGLRNIALAATGLGAIIVTLGLNLQQTTNLVYSAVAGYSAYRGALVLATVAQRTWATVVAASEVALLGLVRGVGGATSAKVAMTGVVAGLTGGLRALTATLIANPFTAVAVAVGTLTAAFVGLANAQAQARTETNNLIMSLRAAAKARSDDFLARRADIQGQFNAAKAELDRLRGSKGYDGSIAPTVGAFNSRLSEQNREVSRLRLELQLADEAYAAAGKAAAGMAVPVAQAGAAAEGAGKQIRGATDAAKAQAEAFQSLYDRLFPYQAATRKFDAELALIQKSRLTDAEKELAIARLIQDAYQTRAGSLGKATVSFDKNAEGPLVDFKKKFDDMQEALEAGVAKTRTQTVQIAQSFREMANSVLSSIRQLADGIRGGDFFSILEGAVGLFTQLGSAGLFGRGLQTRLNSIPGNANGTAFHPGGLMKVGERGPEILQVPRGGRVIPNHELREAGAMSGRLHVTVGIDETGNLRAAVEPMVRQYSGMAAQAGAAMAQSQIVQRSMRRVR